MEAATDFEEQPVEPGDARRIEIAPDAAGYDAVHHQPVAEALIVLPQHLFAQRRTMREHDREGRVVADGADIAEMIGEPFEFRHQRAQPYGARRRRPAERRLDSAGKGASIGHGRIAGAAAGEARRLFEIGTLDQAFDALMDIAKPFLEPHDGLAVGAEAEMARLDDAGMDRADGDLVNVLPFHRQEGIAGRRFRRWMTCAERRADAPSAVVEPGPPVRQAGGNKAEEIGCSALQPDRGRMRLSDRRIAPIGAWHAEHQHAARFGAGGERHMHDLRLAPEIDQRQRAALQALAGLDPDFAPHDKAGPGLMPRDRLARKAVEGIGPARVDHLRRPATF